MDGRTDLYGLGCVAYWLITGSLVFDEKNAAAMMLAHLQKNPVAPSTRSGRAVPACVDRAIMACLAKNPAERPVGADELARLLDNCDGIGSWTPLDADRWWKTNMAEPVVSPDDNPAPTHEGPNALTTYETAR